MTMSLRIGITGSTGLLGSNLANHFVREGHTVYSLIKDEQPASILSKEVIRVYGDITNKVDTDYFVQKCNPNIFFHLAAQTQAFESLKYPFQTFNNNVVGTLNILESLREYRDSSAIIVASSDKAYGELAKDFYTEDHPLNGVYPYDASKSATDLIANSYRETYAMPIVITRACNIYGIGDFNQNRLIPGLILASLNQSEFVVRNSGHDIREYIHVDDVVEAYDAIVKKGVGKNLPGAFNISSGDVHSTLDVVEAVSSLVSGGIRFRIELSNTLEIRRQVMNSDLLTSTTGWRATRNLESELPKIIDWYGSKGLPNGGIL